MNDSSVRSRILVLAGLTAASVLVACGEDKRVKQLQAGISRDSAVSVIAQDVRGTGSDSFPNVYTRERYIIGGKNHEVLYFTPDNAKEGKDTVTFAKLTPLVFVDQRLIAKGWPAWDSISKANNIPLKDHSK